jgi:hypothetical protein
LKEKEKNTRPKCRITEENIERNIGKNKLRLKIDTFSNLEKKDLTSRRTIWIDGELQFAIFQCILKRKS